MSEVSAYIQPDHFDSDKKNVNDFLGQNPLLLLARTCQNIGVETKSASATSSLSGSSSVKSATIGTLKPSSNSSSSNANPFSISSSFNKVAPSRSVAKATTTMIPPVQTFPPLNGTSQQSPKLPQSNSVPPTGPSAIASADESELYIPPSSNSLIQLARLSSSLKIPSPSTNSPSLGGERQKRNNKSIDVQPPTSKFGLGGLSALPPPPPGVKPQKRSRRQSFGRTSGNAKPLDFSSHLSSHSSPLSTSSSSVSPSSLRSTPPSHTSPTPPNPNVSQPPSMNPTSYEFMKSLATAGLSMPVDSCTSAAPSPLEAFFSVGSLFGSSPESLRELLVSIARSLSERRAAESNLLLEQQQQQQQQSKVLHGSVSDPSTQCLYCGHVCSDMSSLVQHIYIHLASLHKQQTEVAAAAPPPPTLLPPQPAPIIPPASTPPFDLATFYAKLLQKNADNQLTTASFQPPMVSPDPNSLFLAWLNLLRPAYAEGLTGAANR